MKKITIFILSVLLALSATACSNNSEIEELKKENEQLKQQLFEIQNGTSQNLTTQDNQFDTYDILSFKLSNDDKTSYEEEIIQTYTVTNNSSFSLKEFSIDVVYYDSADNIICKDSRFSDVLLEPGKSIDIKSFSDVKGDKDKIAYSSIVSYDYTATDFIKDEYDSVDVNLQTKELEWYK